MAYVLGTLLFETSGGNEGTKNQSVNVTSAVTARVEFGHVLQEGSIGKGATAGAKLYINDELVGQVFSASPGYSVSGSASVAFLPKEKYVVRVTGENSQATTHAIWIKGIVTINSD